MDVAPTCHERGTGIFVEMTMRRCCRCWYLCHSTADCVELESGCALAVARQDQPTSEATGLRRTATASTEYGVSTSAVELLFEAVLRVRSVSHPLWP